MSASDADRLARVGLSQLGEPGDPRIARAVAELGAEQTFERIVTDLHSPDLLGADAAARFPELDPVGALTRADRLGIRFVVPGDAEWPTRLDRLDDVEEHAGQGGRPLGLWVRGPLRLDAIAASIAVVGCRSATTYGVEVALDVGAVAARAGLTVVSGAAVGIDAAGHRGALSEGGDTVAVLACGADRIYPRANAGLLEHLTGNGAVVSETPPGGAPTRHRFLARNRIIAGLADATVVVEAARRSGSLNTATWADRLLRPVLGVPGPLTSATSEGVHALVHQGKATLLSRPEDVLEVVGRPGEHLVERPAAVPRARDRISRRDRRVLDAVPKVRAASVDSVARVAGMRLIDVSSALGRMERQGLVARVSTGWRLTDAAVSEQPERIAEPP